MRKLCLVLVVLVGCKEKQEAKPTPPPSVPAPAPTQKVEPAPPSADVKPAVPVPVTPAGGFNTAADYEAKAFDLLDKLTDVFARAGTNCEKLADGIEVFLDANKAAFASTDAFEAANPAAEDDLEAKMQDKAKTFMTKASASMQACQNHERVKAALAKLPD